MLFRSRRCGPTEELGTVAGVAGAAEARVEEHAEGKAEEMRREMAARRKREAKGEGRRWRAGRRALR